MEASRIFLLIRRVSMMLCAALVEDLGEMEDKEVFKCTMLHKEICKRMR